MLHYFTYFSKDLKVNVIFTKTKVPHFPSDSSDPFWSSLDLFAAASCAASISDSQNAFLLLELYLHRSQPDLSLQAGSGGVGDGSRLHTWPQQPGGLPGILGLCWCQKRPWSRGTFSSSSTGWENFVELEMKSLLNRSCNCIVYAVSPTYIGPQGVCT